MIIHILQMKKQVYLSPESLVLGRVEKRCQTLKSVPLLLRLISLNVNKVQEKAASQNG